MLQNRLLVWGEGHSKSTLTDLLSSYTYGRGSMPTSVHVFVKARSIRCPGAGFIGGCEFRSSVRVECSFNFQAIFPAPRSILSLQKRWSRSGYMILKWSPGFRPIRETRNKIKLEIEFFGSLFDANPSVSEVVLDLINYRLRLQSTSEPVVRKKSQFYST